MLKSHHPKRRLLGFSLLGASVEGDWEQMFSPCGEAVVVSNCLGDPQLYVRRALQCKAKAAKCFIMW